MKCPNSCGGCYNIPLGALAARGCTHAIVIHLGNGETWNRHDFAQQTVVEIRPEQRINKFDTPILGSVSSLLDFSAGRIAELKRRGYEDAKRCLEPIIQTFSSVQAQRQSHHSLINLTAQLLMTRYYDMTRCCEHGAEN